MSSLIDSPQVLSEPIAKNTAPAIVLASKYILDTTKKDPIILVVPSDHMIKDSEAFARTVKEGEKLAELGYIVTFGIKPSYPETGYGYVNISDLKIESGYKVKCFVEKPNSELAKEYIADGNYFWNSGIFMFKASTMLKEAEKCASEIYDLLKNFDFKKALVSSLLIFPFSSNKF